jgi:UDP-N-acetylmuramyl pentapeptide synthase
VNDTYNANPVSMRSAVKTLSAIVTKGKKILVLADMLELGGKSKILHESIGREIAESSANLLITTGTFARCICQGLRKKNAKIMNFHCPDLQDVHKLLKEYCQKGDVVLVKGSRGMKMERTVQFLKDTFR